MRSLRIVHVANFGFKPVKVYLHGVASKLSNGWVRAGHHVTNLSDRDLARWSSFGIRALGRSAMNRHLVDYCLATRPDVLALGHADVVTADTVAAIRERLPDLKVLQWNVDWLPDPAQAHVGDPTPSDNLARIRRKAEVVDVTFVTSAGPALERLQQAGVRAAFFPNPTDPSVETGRNFEREDLPADVFFAAGSDDRKRFHAGQWRDMAEMVADLKARVPSARVEAHGFEGRPLVFGPAYQAALERAAIGLNISRRNDLYLYSSDRLAHLAGNGLAVCIDRATGYGDLFGEDEFAFYSTEDELFEAVERLVADPARRMRLARNGWRRYGELCGCDVVARQMIETLYGASPASHRQAAA